ncbi:MAG: putative ABC transporter permease, partial [Lachnospiraceae bacterium]|nr:putative ABC transporter permease [Lachnospiraceae bacterium]
MGYTFYEAAILYFTYSFFAWAVETAVATLRVKNFLNRGFASGPFCFIYGFTGVLLTLTLQDLRENMLFLFLGSALIATGVEWFTGKLLERMKQKKWWDYSDKKWNFDGYICLQYSLLWGLLGFLVVRYVNGFVLHLYHVLPDICGKVLIWSLVVVGTVDIFSSLMTVYHIDK